MKAALEAVLACPLDGTPVHVETAAHEDGAELIEGTLVCQDGHAFDVKHAIPRMLLDAGGGLTSQNGTSETFGTKWKLLRDEDQERMIRFQHEWYDERYGWGSEAGLERFLDGREMILDAGCGLGRDVARYARLSRAQVIGFDLSDSVERAHRDFGAAENAHFLQADILTPIFAPETFDFVIADQVIHHTPDAARAFATLATLVRPGGQIAAYVYRTKALLREAADTQLRALTTRLSVEECMEFSAQITELGRELSRLGATITLEQGVPLLGIAPGEQDVQRLIYWHFLKCFWNEDLGEHQSLLGNFDWYHPPYASRHTPEEVEAWCEAAALDVVHLDVIESGISVRAARS
jgi:SAM-dependent methyltransferase/uncharacterized protein YbaR (Trm112 family)